MTENAYEGRRSPKPRETSAEASYMLQKQNNLAPARGLFGQRQSIVKDGAKNIVKGLLNKLEEIEHHESVKLAQLGAASRQAISMHNLRQF